MNIKQALTLRHNLTESDSARLDCDILLCHALDKDKVFLFAYPEYELSPEEQTTFEQLMARRQKGEPVAYIVGVKEFWSMPFKVSADTLIPRADTELLVELAVADLHRRLSSKATEVGHLKVLDLGTGTGAIAAAIAKECPSCSVIAVDNHAGAVELALENITNLKLPNVEVRQSNWFDAVADMDFDVIVSNPPYIHEDDEHLRQGDVRFEPRSALVSGDDGLRDMTHIIAHAAEKLKPGASLFLEHGWKQAMAVQNIFAANDFVNVETFKDIQGRDRVTKGIKPPE